MENKRKTALDFGHNINLRADKTIGANLSFGATEAYKLLRTNLDFSLLDVEGCKLIGVTSALRGEGKSTTAINLAYTMVQTGQRVLLLEADLRLPTAAKRLGIHSHPGISDFLIGLCTGSDIMQQSPLMDDLWIIAAGNIPPNPAELLGSEKTERTLNMLAAKFDVIIVDLPPISAVSDALVMSKLLNGMVVVCRQNYCERRALDDAVNKLKFAESKILGFVITDSDLQKKNYGRYGEYKSPAKNK